MTDSKNIPGEVLLAIAVRMAGQPVGKELYDKVIKAIEDYPEYFPWETKYNSIPQEIHEAYKKEKYPWMYEDIYNLKKSIECKGIWEQLKEVPKPTKQSLPDMIHELFKNQEEEHQRRKQKEQEDKELWDKYYKKYDPS